jgi:endonuclease YncB( thermonuclease family)
MMRTIAVLSSLLVVLWSPAALAEPARIIGTAQVQDGDTVDIGTVRMRLHGIDAPEASQTCTDRRGKDWSCGTAATNRLAALIDGEEVECLALDRDMYGRVIGTCYRDGIDINAALVREGLAWAYTRFSEDYVEVEQIARDASLGIWQADNVPAWEWRAQRWERAVAASPDGCPIKGNINRQGERIYHTPWSRWYDRVQIDEARGQRWFCDEAEAEAAGWRAPLR